MILPSTLSLICEVVSVPRKPLALVSLHRSCIYRPAGLKIRRRSFDRARRTGWFGPSLDLRDSQDRQRYRTYAVPRYVNGAGIVRLTTVQWQILQATGELRFENKRLRQSACGRHDRADVVEGFVLDLVSAGKK